MTLPKHAQIWLPGVIGHYARQYARAARGVSRRGGAHVMFAIADHFEPFNGGVSQDRADRRVERWQAQYPRMAEGLRDVDGQMPRH
jgi:hypothetical protein